LYRLRGELLLRQGGAEDEAEACFRQALESARRQSAKSLELRAALSLCRLQRARGRPEGRAALAAVYAWFGEGFETRDMREARGLLAEPA
jgi:predicted ATPase